MAKRPKPSQTAHVRPGGEPIKRGRGGGQASTPSLWAEGSPTGRQRRYGGAMTGLFARPRAEIVPGAVHLPGWLTPGEQRQLVAACREWAEPPAGMRHTPMPSGGQMSAQTVCLGWHWMPYRYSRTADDVDGAPVKPFPTWLGDLGRQAVADAYGDQHLAGRYHPDVALINFYDGTARMGMHADRDERSSAPVVSLSLGSACIFRFGNAQTRGKPWHDVMLASGDLFVFGGEARFAYHGVTATIPGTEQPEIGLPAGRLNITLRESGLT